MKLAEKNCVPCRGGVPSLPQTEVDKLLAQLDGWQCKGGKKIVKSYQFDDFLAPMKMANEIAAIAESQGHHPDLHIRWGTLKVEIWTHKIDGLTENDFVLAAKIDQIKQ